MPAPLKSLWELRAVAAGAPAAVRVRNLRTTVTGPEDAWERSGRTQPASISATVTFHDEFGASASTDSVASDTVHYGLLSKAILFAIGQPRSKMPGSLVWSDCSLGSMMQGIWLHLTGMSFDHDDDDDDDDDEFKADAPQEPFLKLKSIRTLEITVHLPKATLLGDGVSATEMAEFNLRGRMVAQARSIEIHGMRVPTLIGVNENERQAKQMVVASIAVDHLQTAFSVDRYDMIAGKLVEVMSESSFETLEALAQHVARDLSVIMDSPWFTFGHIPLARLKPDNFRLHISLEKPIAIALADAACVELNVWTKHVADAERAKESKGERGTEKE